MHVAAVSPDSDDPEPFERDKQNVRWRILVKLLIDGGVSVDELTGRALYTVCDPALYFGKKKKSTFSTILLNVGQQFSILALYYLVSVFSTVSNIYI